MRTIEITTTQHVTIEYELSSVRDRIVAFLIDVMIVGVAYLVLVLALVNTLPEEIFDSSLSANLVIRLLPIGLFIAYQLFSEILSNGQSWGKKAMGIQVVRLDGKEPELSDYLLRAIFHIIDTLLSVGIVAALLISSSAKSQRLGDMTANTTVIKLRSSLRFQLEDILKINSLDDYQPTYEQVRQLSEQDMLFIKSAISRYRQHPNEAHSKAIRQLTGHLAEMLDIAEQPVDNILFLKTLIRDYIVLTR